MMETQGGGGDLTYEVEREVNGLACSIKLIKGRRCKNSFLEELK